MSTPNALTALNKLLRSSVKLTEVERNMLFRAVSLYENEMTMTRSLMLLVTSDAEALGKWCRRSRELVIQFDRSGHNIWTAKEFRRFVLADEMKDYYENAAAVRTSHQTHVQSALAAFVQHGLASMNWEVAADEIIDASDAGAM